jgi:anti-sigma factor RsiW
MTELACVNGVVHLMDYLEGAVSPELRDALEQHVAGCRRCAAFLASYQATPRILRDVTDVVLPPRTGTSLRLFLRAQRGEPS